MTEEVKVPRRRGYTRVSSKNQITLPAAALTAAHIKPGDHLRVDVDGTGVIRLIQERDPLDALIASAPGLSAVTDLQGLRDEWPG